MQIPAEAEITDPIPLSDLWNSWFRWFVGGKYPRVGKWSDHDQIWVREELKLIIRGPLVRTQKLISSKHFLVVGEQWQKKKMEARPYPLPLFDRWQGFPDILSVNPVTQMPLPSKSLRYSLSSPPFFFIPISEIPPKESLYNFCNLGSFGRGEKLSTRHPNGPKLWGKRDVLALLACPMMPCVSGFHSR